MSLMRTTENGKIGTTENGMNRSPPNSTNPRVLEMDANPKRREQRYGRLGNDVRMQASQVQGWG